MRTTIGFAAGAIALVLAAPASADGVKKHKTTKTEKAPDGEAVSTTRTTSFAPEERDVAESRAAERRDLEDKRWTLAPMLGWGSNGYGFGVGARLGYTFATPIYVGGNFMFHAGEGARSSVFYPSGEVGYDIGVGSVLLRPYGGLGVLVDGSTRGLVYPGFTAQWLVPRSPMFVGGDARVLLPFTGTAALAVMATTGLNF